MYTVHVTWAYNRWLNCSDHTLNCESNIVRDSVELSVVLIARSTLEHVAAVHHVFTDDEYSSLHDGSIDSISQVCPLIGRRWVAFCWTLYCVSRLIARLSRSYLQVSWRNCSSKTITNVSTVYATAILFVCLSVCQIHPLSIVSESRVSVSSFKANITVPKGRICRCSSSVASSLHCEIGTQYWKFEINSTLKSSELSVLANNNKSRVILHIATRRRNK